MSIWTIGWLLWIAWFVVEEGLAFATHGRGATLSEHVWRWFAIPEARDGTTLQHPRVTSWAVRGRRFALLAFLAWLAFHFLTGGAF